MQQQSQEPVATLLYRIESMEKDITRLKAQFDLYVPARENDLQLRSVRETVERMERDVTKAREEIGIINTRLISQEKDLQTRDAAQRESQDKLQIRVLWGIVSTVVVILSGVLIAFLTHLIH